MDWVFALNLFCCFLCSFMCGYYLTQEEYGWAAFEGVLALVNLVCFLV